MTKFSVPSNPRPFQMYINGQWVDSAQGETITRHSPAHDVPVTIIPKATPSDVDNAVRAAQEALGNWAKLHVSERAGYLYKAADAIEQRAEEIALLETLENGKTIGQSLGEVIGAANNWRYAAGVSRGLHGESHNNIGDDLLGLTLREPIGVVALITPWNFPFFILAERLPYIMASGCTCVIKPSEATSSTTLLMAEILHDVGVPAGVINVVTGGGGSVGQPLLDHSDVDMVSFTGSTAVGRKVIEASVGTIKKVGLELGGKNPQVVFADADIESAVDGVAFGLCINSGQCCVSGSRLFVERTIADEFTEKLKQTLQGLTTGDPLDETTQLGAITTTAQYETILNYIKEGQNEGATLVCGGNAIQADKGVGYYVEPTIFTDCTFDMSIVNQEIFGPVIVIIPFDTFEQAVTYANDTEYGLGASIWTSNLDKALMASRQIKAGRVWVNTTLAGGPEMPFGGMKQSGLGTECGLYGVEEYTTLKAIHIQLGPRGKIYK